VTPLVGSVFAALFGRTLNSGGNLVAHFQHAGSFWLGGIVLAILLVTFLCETEMPACATHGAQCAEDLTESTS
jgi:hypothetical protein